MSLRLERGTVQLEPHDKYLDKTATQTIETLKSILGDDAIDIQRIGSTAIPAIKAKPIIDIVVEVTDFDRIMLHNEQLRRKGIFYQDSDVECQLLYVMGDMEADIRTHHIHIVKWNGTEWKNYIHFIDYLKANENMALQYENLKEEMEGRYADDRVAYTNNKQNMINRISGK
ncbi:GrpB family protein [Ruminococcus sp.]|uniref:GrpB family protein n=1 Tax=Ruminococcus sp. TaxID=41978 RepID=UPI004029AA7B